MSDGGATVAFSANVEHDPVDLLQGKLSMGRAAGCDVRFPDNKFISGLHCELHRSGVGACVLVDLSSNGTILNGVRKLTKGERVALNDGDVVYLVKKRSLPGEDISFTYFEAAPPTDAARLGNDVAADQTLAYSPDFDVCRPPAADTPPVDADDAAATQLDANDVSASATMPLESLADGADAAPIAVPRLTRVRDALPPAVDVRPPAAAATLRRGSTAQLSRDASSTASLTAAPSSPADRALATESAAEAPVDKPAAAEVAAKAPSVEPPAKVARQASDGEQMQQMLTCAICCEIIHDCVSVAPCIHKFCGGCYSEWMQRSSHCPVCRVKVVSISKDHQFNGVVESFLLKHPEKKRPDDELAELNSKNKIVAENMKRPRRQRNQSNDEDDDEDGDADEDEESFSDTDYSDDDDSADEPVGAVAGRFVCRQCPGAAPPTVDGAYRCQPNQNHLLCQCCLQPFPDRRHEVAAAPLAPTQCGSGTTCRKFFCNAYWQCRGSNCVGCLVCFKDLRLTDQDLTLWVNGNEYESKVLSDYLNSVGKNWETVRASVCNRAQANPAGAAAAAASIVSPETIVCHACGVREFQKFAYDFRAQIKDADLPKNVTARENCWWGKNCNTQRSRADHARRLNHICDQTRF